MPSGVDRHKRATFDPQGPGRILRFPKPRLAPRQLAGTSRPSSPGSQGETGFGLELEVHQLGNTAVIGRIRDESTFIIRPRDRNYCHSYEDEMTRATNESSAHNFGGIKLMVRYKPAGYVHPDSVNPGLARAERSRRRRAHRNPVRLAPHHPRPEPDRHERTLDLRTRSCYASNQHVSDEVAARLYASQTTKLVRAYQIDGVLVEVGVEDVTSLLDSWRVREQDVLRTLACWPAAFRVREMSRETRRVAMKWNPRHGRLVMVNMSRR